MGGWDGMGERGGRTDNIDALWFVAVASAANAD